MLEARAQVLIRNRACHARRQMTRWRYHHPLQLDTQPVASLDAVRPKVLITL